MKICGNDNKRHAPLSICQHMLCRNRLKKSPLRLKNGCGKTRALSTERTMNVKFYLSSLLLGLTLSGAGRVLVF